MLVNRTGKLHPALYLHGLLAAAEKAGASLHSGNEARAIEGSLGRFELRTARDRARAREVVIATNGYTDTLTPFLRRRIVPVASYLIAIELLPEDLAASLLPTGRTLTAACPSVRTHVARRQTHVVRRTGQVNANAPQAAAAALHSFMCEIFPQLQDYRITHAWCGNVAFTFDFLPHAGVCDGLQYCLGCNSSGISMMTVLGRNVANRILGAESGGAFERASFPTRPLYRGDPNLFLPFVGSAYRFGDWLDRICAR